jgi:ubiquitin C-terminal hydrolase
MPHRITDFAGDLDLADYLTAAAAGARAYRLKAVVFHHGTSLADGHYTAYLRRDRGWWHANDSRVTDFQGDIHTAGGSPYLFIYEQTE